MSPLWRENVPLPETAPSGLPPKVSETSHEPSVALEHLECEMQPLSRDARLHCPIAISHEWYGIAGPQWA